MTRPEATTEPNVVPTSSESVDIKIPLIGKARVKRWVLRGVFMLVLAAASAGGGHVWTITSAAYAAYGTVQKLDGLVPALAPLEKVTELTARVDKLEAQSQAMGLTLCFICTRERGRKYHEGDCPICPHGVTTP